jgi:plasmid maintenance system killer protein
MANRYHDGIKNKFEKDGTKINMDYFAKRFKRKLDEMEESGSSIYFIN